MIVRAFIATCIVRGANPFPVFALTKLPSSWRAAFLSRSVGSVHVSFFSSSIDRFLKLSFHSVADLMEVKKALMPTIQVRGRDQWLNALFNGVVVFCVYAADCFDPCDSPDPLFFFFAWYAPLELHTQLF